MGSVGFNDVYERLKMRYAVLKEECATLIESYSHLVKVVGPNLRSRYMMVLGQFENRIYELKMEISRWQRRFTMRQMALNRGEKPDYALVESKLDEEFSIYKEKVRQHIAELQEAIWHCSAEKMTERENHELRIAYLNAVKRLHPDINPDLPEGAKTLWSEIQDAYQDGQWEKLRFFCELVDGVAQDGAEIKTPETAVEVLEDRIKGLEPRCVEMHAKIAKLKAGKPFVYERLLEDEEEVKSRQGVLFVQITELENCVKKYGELWEDGK